MREELPNYNMYGNMFTIKKIKIKDSNEVNIIRYFGECLNFIKGEEKILVHCRAGKSRSPTIVAAYLMWDKKLKYLDALDYIIRKRSIINPNDGFKEQLKIFEKLLIENNYDIYKINFKLPKTNEININYYNDYLFIIMVFMIIITPIILVIIIFEILNNN